MSHTSTDSPVVVGVDGSDPSVRALNWAAQQAFFMNVPLEVVTAWNSPVSPAPFGIPVHEPFQEDLMATAQARLDDLVLKLPQAAEVDAKVIRGDVAHVLLTEAKAGVLLVVGRRGCGRFEPSLTGSVSDRCVRHAECPVVVVP